MRGLRMWFPDQVSELLAAVYEGMSSAAAIGPLTDQAEGFQRGMVAALNAVAAGFGVPSPGQQSMKPQPRTWEVVDASGVRIIGDNG